MPLPTSPARHRTVCAGLLLGLLATLAPAGLRAADFVPPTPEEALAALGSLDTEPAAARRLLVPDEAFEPIEAPGPGDWLATHDERGQSYEEFVEVGAQPIDERRRVIYLQPLGEFAADSAPSLEALRDYAAAFFQVDVVLLPADMVESAAFEPRFSPDTRKPQLRSTAILTWLYSRLPDDAFCIVAVTMTDLYPGPGWNFVYGQASARHRAGVFSFSRHDPLFFGQDRPDDFDALLLRRSAKTLVHEIAHLFGLAHCIHFRCVENGVNHQVEADSRPHQLCPVCLRKVRHATGADLERRYRDLVYFYSQHTGWEVEDAWVRRQLARLRDPMPQPNRSITIPQPPAFPTAPGPGTLPIPAAPTPDVSPSPAPAPRSPPDIPPSPVPSPIAASEPLVADGGRGR